ncbi:LysE family translocator [Trichloromonas sp.]|uniref:LysE family translocator n=1 Tax=Trichloromonas sp. TaxID=3069249 RepID=UPI002A4178EC|nr:LysE family translocator [Trichloromonas sp.]
MIPFDTLLLFFTTSVLLGLSPGPDNLFVLAQSAQRGPGAGLLVTLGLCTGLLVHTAAVAFGLAAVFQASVLAFNLLKWAGAGYLLYLAVLAFRAKADAVDSSGAAVVPRSRLYRRGIIMNITNPKVSVFFLAFLPQFADPSRGPLAVQLLILGGIFIVATLLVFGSVSLLAGAVGERLRRSGRAQILLNRLAGTVFAALALKLATSTR